MTLSCRNTVWHWSQIAETRSHTEVTCILPFHCYVLTSFCWNDNSFWSYIARPRTDATVGSLPLTDTLVSWYRLAQIQHSRWTALHIKLPENCPKLTPYFCTFRLALYCQKLYTAVTLPHILARVMSYKTSPVVKTMGSHGLNVNSSTSFFLKQITHLPSNLVFKKLSILNSSIKRLQRLFQSLQKSLESTGYPLTQAFRWPLIWWQLIKGQATGTKNRFACQLRKWNQFALL